MNNVFEFFNTNCKLWNTSNNKTVLFLNYQTQFYREKNRRFLYTAPQSQPPLSHIHIPTSPSFPSFQKEKKQSTSPLKIPRHRKTTDRQYSLFPPLFLSPTRREKSFRGNARLRAVYRGELPVRIRTYVPTSERAILAFPAGRRPREN